VGFFFFNLLALLLHSTGYYCRTEWRQALVMDLWICGLYRIFSVY
jgi:hypothetical protein